MLRSDSVRYVSQVAYDVRDRDRDRARCFKINRRFLIMDIQLCQRAGTAEQSICDSAVSSLRQIRCRSPLALQERKPHDMKIFTLTEAQVLQINVSARKSPRF